MSSPQDEPPSAVSTVLSSALSAAVSAAVAVATAVDAKADLATLLDEWEEAQQGTTELLVFILTKLAAICVWKAVIIICFIGLNVSGCFSWRWLRLFVCCRISELIERETGEYHKADPDPFDDRHPGCHPFSPIQEVSGARGLCAWCDFHRSSFSLLCWQCARQGFLSWTKALVLIGCWVSDSCITFQAGRTQTACWANSWRCSLWTMTLPMRWGLLDPLLSSALCLVNAVCLSTDVWWMSFQCVWISHTCFLFLEDECPKIFSFYWYKTEKNSKSSLLRTDDWFDWFSVDWQ